MGHRPLAILGTHLLAPEVAEIAREAGFEVSCFIENLDRSRCDRELDGLPVRWVTELEGLSRTHVAVCGLGTTQRRRFVEEAFAYGMSFMTLVHPNARISSLSSLGEGTIVSPGVVIASHTRIGRHVLLNRGVLVGHDTEIGDYVSIMPGANIAGVCRVDHAAWIGMSATVIDRTRVGAGSIIGAGAVVTEDIPDRVTVVGVPARIVKKDVEPR